MSAAEVQFIVPRRRVAGDEDGASTLVLEKLCPVRYANGTSQVVVSRLVGASRRTGEASWEWTARRTMDTQPLSPPELAYRTVEFALGCERMLYRAEQVSQAMSDEEHDVTRYTVASPTAVVGRRGDVTGFFTLGRRSMVGGVEVTARNLAGTTTATVPFRRRTPLTGIVDACFEQRLFENAAMAMMPSSIGTLADMIFADLMLADNATQRAVVRTWADLVSRFLGDLGFPRTAWPHGSMWIRGAYAYGSLLAPFPLSTDVVIAGPGVHYVDLRNLTIFAPRLGTVTVVDGDVTFQFRGRDSGFLDPTTQRRLPYEVTIRAPNRPDAVLYRDDDRRFGYQRGSRAWVGHLGTATITGLGIAVTYPLVVVRGQPVNVLPTVGGTAADFTLVLSFTHGAAMPEGLTLHPLTGAVAGSSSALPGRYEVDVTVVAVVEVPDNDGGTLPENEVRDQVTLVIEVDDPDTDSDDDSGGASGDPYVKTFCA